MIFPPILPSLQVNGAAWAAMKTRLGDLTPIMETMVDNAATEFLEKQFETEGTHGGVAWPPLAPLTLLLRQRPGHGLGGIGIDTTRMWKSLIEQGGEGVTQITPSSYVRGTLVPYARYFNEGTDRQPARPIWPNPLPQFFLDQLANIISYWVATGRESSGKTASPKVDVTI